MKSFRALAFVISTSRSLFSRISPTTRRLLVVAAFWVFAVHVLAAATAGFAISKGPGPVNWSPQLRALETPLSRWDSRWFYTVITEGYYSSRPGFEGPVRFYPLYPVLMIGAGWLTRLTPMWAGTLVSVLALFGSVLLLARLGRDSDDPDSSFATTHALLFFPSAFVLATVYSDGLALFTALATITLARSGRWWLAGVMGALACCSRMNACLVILPLMVLAVAKWRTDDRWRPLPALVLTVVGAAAFPVYLWCKFGDPLLYFHTTSKGWVQHPRFFLSFMWDIAKAVVSAVTGGAVPRDVQTMAKAAFPVNVAVLLVMFWALVATLRKRKWDEAAFMAGGTALAISVGSLDSLARIALIYFPIYLRLGELLSAHRTVRSIVLPVLISTQTVVLILFTHWWFVL